jgi:hypothetical protein
VKVVLRPDVFAPPVQNALLVTLISHAIDDRHRVEFDESHPHVEAWVSQQAEGLREEIRVALEVSAQAEVLEPSHTVVEVTCASASDFEDSPIRLHLNDARQFLERPLVVLLEDQVSDRGFLARMMTDEERRFFDRRAALGFIRIDHGGGLGSMTRRVTQDAASPATRHRLWLMFDSDAMQPGQPSRDAERLRIASARVAHYQLGRRYMESYLPRPALMAWAANQANRRVREERLAKVRAFVDLSEDQRHYYNMKEGFAGDVARIANSADSPGTLYDDVPDDSRRTLDAGFGSDIGDLYQQGVVTEADLRRDTGWDELRPVVLDLIARMR